MGCEEAQGVRVSKVRISKRRGLHNGGHSDYTEAERKILIIKALEHCGQSVTPEAVESQFLYETKGRKWKTEK